MLDWQPPEGVSGGGVFQNLPRGANAGPNGSVDGSTGSGRVRGFAGEEQRSIHGAAEKSPGGHGVDRHIAIGAAEKGIGVPIVEMRGKWGWDFSIENSGERCERLSDDRRLIETEQRLGGGPGAPAGKER